MRCFTRGYTDLHRSFRTRSWITTARKPAKRIAAIHPPTFYNVELVSEKAGGSS